MPDFQVVSLGELNPYMGRFPNDKLLALPSNVVRHVQGIERGTFGFGDEIPLPFAKFLSEIEISMLDKLYPIHGHPVFDFIGFKSTPEESYNSTIDLRACYRYITRPIWHTEEDTSFTKRRHELGEQYKKAIKMLLRNEETRLNSDIRLLEKAIIELKSSSQKSIALSDKQKGLISELVDSGFKIYTILAQFKSDWTVEFTLHELSKL
jgi:hypothetical protein